MPNIQEERASRSKQRARVAERRLAVAEADRRLMKPSPRRHRASDADDFKTSMLTIRVKRDLKVEASKTLEDLGISLPEAVRAFLARVVRERALPFPLESPNAETSAP